MTLAIFNNNFIRSRWKHSEDFFTKRFLRRSLCKIILVNVPLPKLIIMWCSVGDRIDWNMINAQMGYKYFATIPKRCYAIIWERWMWKFVVRIFTKKSILWLVKLFTRNCVDVLYTEGYELLLFYFLYTCVRVRM